MSTTVAVHWVPLATSVAAGLVAYVVATRAVPPVVRAVLHEVDYRVSHPVGALLTGCP